MFEFCLFKGLSFNVAWSKTDSDLDNLTVIIIVPQNAEMSLQSLCNKLELFENNWHNLTITLEIHHQLR